MGNSAYNRLTYAGNVYDIFVAAYSPTDKLDFTNITNYYNIPLSFINRLEIGSSIASPLLNGSIKFVTKGTNPFQTIFREMCSYLYININLVNINGTNESVKNDYTFEHTFLVTNVNITNVSKNYVEYDVSFISSHWWNFENMIYVSTHGNEKNFIELLVESFSKAGLTFDASTAQSTNKNIVYTSSHNDSLKTIAPYLLSKSLDPYEDINVENFRIYSYVYNHILDKYELWNLSNVINTLHEIYTNKDNSALDLVTVSLNNNNPLITPTDPNIEIYQTSLYNRPNVYKGLATTNLYGFDFSKNEFKKYSLVDNNKAKLIDSQWHSTLSEVYNAKYNAITKSSSAFEYPTTTPIDFAQHWSASDNSSLYSNGLNMMLATDSVLIKTRCDIRRRPGNIISIFMNEDINVITDTNPDDYSKSLMKTYDGYYVITDNRMVFELDQTSSKHMFRNYLFLNRPVNLK